MALSTTFLFAGLLALAGPLRVGPYIAALCTLAGLAVRETAWIFPAVFLLTEHLRGTGPAEQLRKTGPSLVVVAAALITFLLEPHYRQLIDVSTSLRGFEAQLRAQVEGLGYLLSQLVSLTPNIDPDLRVPPHWTSGLMLQAAALMTLLVTSAWYTLRKRSWLAAGILWFFVLLVPTNSFMPRVDIANDRHLYIAIAGPLWSLLIVLQAGALMVTLSVATLIRNEDYRSELALWARTSVQSPEKPRVWNNLGIACLQAERPDCALQAFRRAVQLDPHDSRAGVNLYFLEKRRPNKK
jgi:tetratricopeptide (TPR) repeat protein